MKKSVEHLVRAELCSRFEKIIEDMEYYQEQGYTYHFGDAILHNEDIADAIAIVREAAKGFL